MPLSTARGFKTHYVEEGHGPAVVFAHGFLFDHTMYAAQFEDLPDRYRCIARDMRGHGRSECPDGPWSMQDLVVDLIRFIEDVDAAPCHLVGMSIGGMIAVRLALQREDLVRSLVMIDSTADAEDPGAAEAYAAYQARADREDGINEDLARETMGFFFSQTFMDQHPDVIDIQVDRETKAPTIAVVEGLRALIGRDSVVDRLSEIRVPTLVIHGEADAAIPMARAEELAGGIAGAELVRVPGAGHTTPVEAPDVVNEALTGFLAGVKR
jgi:pimeloyl-ACP methyl ester carboxylesterase